MPLGNPLSAIAVSAYIWWIEGYIGMSKHVSESLSLHHTWVTTVTLVPQFSCVTFDFNHISCLFDTTHLSHLSKPACHSIRSSQLILPASSLLTIPKLVSSFRWTAEQSAAAPSISLSSTNGKVYDRAVV